MKQYEGLDVDSRWLPDYIEQETDVPYTNEREEGPRLDVFRLRGASFHRPQPLIIWLHGGGWMSGDKERGVERIFPLVRSGFVGASVDYRLSQVAVFPAQVHDCKCAVRFLRHHARLYNVDPERIGVWGASAGGHLASLLAVTGGTPRLDGARGWPDTSSAIQAACSWYGPSNLSWMGDFPPGVKPALANMTADSPEGRLVGGPISERQDLVEMANPVRYIDVSAPPILLMHGERDDYVPLASSERLHAALISQGVPAYLHVVKDGHHNAYLWGDHHLRLVQEFFEWSLRNRDS
jgi:acetyl esterase/lipase